MKIEINKVERDCEVIPAPKGAFCICNIDEGSIGFPQFVIIAPALTTKEKVFGNIVTCPVICCNGGYESADILGVETEIDLDMFKKLVIGYYESCEIDSISVAALDLYDRFLQHDTAISKELEFYMDIRMYNRDKDFLEIEKK